MKARIPDNLIRLAARCVLDPELKVYPKAKLRGESHQDASKARSPSEDLPNLPKVILLETKVGARLGTRGLLLRAMQKALE